MHLHIVAVSSGWILQKIAERTCEAANNGETIPTTRFSISHTTNINADVNLYFDFYNCYKGQKTKLDIAYYTHAHMNSIDFMKNELLEKQAHKLDGIISMNKRYTEMLEKLEFPSDKITTIIPGQVYDKFPLKKIKIGVVSRGGHPGYGSDFIENLIKQYEFKNFKLKFLGKGWEHLRPIASRKKIDLELISNEDYNLYPKFYENIDYLLIPALWTAGPMCMQEALSCGIPIIASNVGFINYEFIADFVYQPGNVHELIKILDSIQEPHLKRRKQIEKLSWKNYAQEIINFTVKLRNDNTSK